ncbi:MAG: hypothetical protein Barrevirus19_5 [Barrevirus sp.]|uniref:Uncharacterized protein n=1 Tax=Barrevirus sp. TaxID=2487763 RepID=A0A3G4ZQN2_9VIRU|nr:MAG: hypothetical protein Barrevirus19_5 [Barrevirus sp.]
MLGPFLTSSIRHPSSLRDAPSQDQPEIPKQEANINNPKVTDTIEQITKVNQQLVEKYKRHNVITDHNFLTDPTIDPMSFFRNVVDINSGLIFEVIHENKKYILQCRPKWHKDSDQDYLDEQFKVWCNALDVSYELEDLKFTNIIKIHHIFIKKTYDPYHKDFYYCIWILKENCNLSYESILSFDYEAESPNYYPDTPATGKHLPGKLISIKAAKQFCKELIVTFIRLLETGYLPNNYSYEDIMIHYQNDIITWKFIEYAFFEKENPTARYIRIILNKFEITLNHLCRYTNHCVRDDMPDNHHPFWLAVNKFIKNSQEKYNKMDGDITLSFDNIITLFKDFQKIIDDNKN